MSSDHSARRVVALALALGCVLALAAGCGSPSTPKSSTDAATDSALPSDASNVGGDGGDVDASASDGGVADGGETDASASDGGALDAGTSDAGGPAPIALTAFCDVVRNDVCTVLRQCSGERYATQADCLADQECGGFADLVQAVNAGDVVWNASTVGRCQARFDASPCDYGVFFFVPSAAEILSACPEIDAQWPGRVADGAPCTMNLACGAHSYCAFASSCPGTCTAYGTEGANCASGPPCDESLGLRCVSDVCTHQIENYDPCMTSTDCGPNGTCIDVGGGTLGCSVGAKEGEACDVFASVAPLCGLALFCDQNVFSPTTAGVCRTVPQSAGGPCSSDFDCASGTSCYSPGTTTSVGTCRALGDVGTACIGNSDCLDTLRCSSSSCVARSAFGTACASDRDCDTALTCVGSKCAYAVDLGGSCDATHVCVESLCIGGTCTARQVLGGSCTVDDDCRSYDCVGGVCVDGDLCVNR